MLRYFRIVLLLEGISLLVLLGIAMPLKHLYHEPLAVRVVGWIHGLLFLAYVMLLASVSAENQWSRKKLIWGFVASILPFGTFFFDRTLRNEPTR